MSIKNFLEAALITLTALSVSAFFAFKSQYTLLGELEHAFVNQSENLVVIKNCALQLPYVDQAYAEELRIQIGKAEQELALSYQATMEIERDFPNWLWPGGTIIDEVDDFNASVSRYLSDLAQYSHSFTVPSGVNNFDGQSQQQLSVIQSIIDPDVHHTGVVIHEHLMGLLFSANRKMVNAFAFGSLMVVLIAFVHLYTHISALKLTQQRLKQSLIQAEQASHAKSLFLSSMSHELKTPMNGVLGIAEVLKDDDTLGDTQRASMDILIQSANHLLTLLGDILDYSKMEQNKLKLKQGEFSFSALIAPIESTFQQQSDEQGVGFELLNSIDASRVFVGDIARIRQIVIKLVSNAFKFTHQGMVSVSIDYLCSSGELVVVVSDTGIGMEQSALNNIFQAFEQSDKGFTRSHDGAGLGLTIVKTLAESMNGTVEVESEVGHGSKFVVRLSVREKQTNVIPPEAKCIELS